jgi:hypothetical protein
MSRRVSEFLGPIGGANDACSKHLVQQRSMAKDGANLFTLAQKTIEPAVETGRKETGKARRDLSGGANHVGRHARAAARPARAVSAISRGIARPTGSERPSLIVKWCSVPADVVLNDRCASGPIKQTILANRVVA